MMEAEWEKCEEPQKMLAFLEEPLSPNMRRLGAEPAYKLSDRKLRLFVAGCCRTLLWNELPYYQRYCVEMAEQAVDLDGWPATRQSTANLAWQQIGEDYSRGRDPVYILPARLITNNGPDTAREAVRLLSPAHDQVLVNLLRDIAGNPRRPARLPVGEPQWEPCVRCHRILPQLDVGRRLIVCAFCEDFALLPSWGPCPWLTKPVLAIARAIYSDRSFGDLPILADALEDAGCDNEDVLRHCRDAGPHVRGCWLIDLLLGKS